MSSNVQPVEPVAPPYWAELEAAIACHRAGQLDDAARAYEHILVQHASCADAENLLGVIAQERGDLATALARFDAAIAINPREPTFHYHRAVTLQALHRTDDARHAYERALELKPDHVRALENLGVLYSSCGNRDAARTTLERALTLTPDAPQLLANYAEVLRAAHDHTAAVAAARRAVALAPNFALARSNLAAILYQLGDIDGTIAELQPLLAANPHDHSNHSTWLMTQLYRDDFDPERSFAAHRAWDDRHGKPLRQHFAAVRSPQALQRRLRLGYVSADLRRHAVARFMAPILQHHDHQQFEIFCYSDAPRPDAVTQRLRAHTDHWRDSRAWSDEQLAQTIRDDDIDILVDLAGHTSGNRMRVFAQRAAPVQINYCGYPASTGLATMDYRITDAQADPPGTTERWHSETLLRLPDTFLCYEPLANAPAPQGPPAVRNGHITFASFNNLAKLTRQTVATWAKLLRALPSARLLLKTPSLSHGESQQRVLDWFAAENIGPQRLELIGMVRDDIEFLTLYHRVDIALDTFPYHGTTTTCDALWMGVPVITHAGAHHVSRVGVSLLHAVGLDDLIAPTASAVVDKAILLANDLPRLQQLRHSLRNIMRVLPLTQGGLFTRQFEDALHQAWNAQCAAAPAPTNHPSRPAESAALSTQSRGDTMSTETMLPGNVRCFARDSLDDLASYVLREQHDWFESDIRFVRRYLRPRMRVLDVGAGIGVYALTAAQRVGPHGIVDAVEADDELSALLRLGQEANSFAQLALHKLEGTATLSDIARQSPANRAGYDLIRIDGEINAIEAVQQLRGLLTASAPLLMVFTHADAALADQLKHALQTLGYNAYVHVPGLDQLALDCDPIADPYQLNLFFATAERAAELARHGLLAPWRDASDVPQPAPGALLWHEHIARLPYSTAFASVWNAALTGSVTLPAQDTYRHGLNLYVMAHSVHTDDEDRFGYLLAAFEQVSAAIATQASAARLLTLARLCAELGLRNTAVKTLATLRDALGGNDALDVAEPFIPPLAEFEMLCEQDSPGTWLVRVIVTAYEQQVAFSSYFNDNDNLHYLGGLDAQNLLTPALQQRYALQHQRLTGKAPTPTKPTQPKPGLAVLYHLARTGGTLISKCLASIDGNALLSEVNPGVSVQDPLLQAQKWYGLFGEDEYQLYRAKKQLNYRETIKLIADRLTRRGQKLILRDWTHIDFTAVPFVEVPRYTLSQAELLAQDFTLHQAFTVRHPLDTYMSLVRLNLSQDALAPAMFMRGYCALARFAQSHGFYRYEDFCTAPQKTLRALCSALNVNYSDQFINRYASYRNVTGEVVSERGGETIKLPQRRQAHEALIDELRDNDDYLESIELLGYDRGF